MFKYKFKYSHEISQYQKQISHIIKHKEEFTNAIRAFWLLSQITRWDRFLIKQVKYIIYNHPSDWLDFIITLMDSDYIIHTTDKGFIKQGLTDGTASDRLFLTFWGLRERRRLGLKGPFN